MPRFLVAVVLVFSLSAAQAAPYKPATAAQRETLAVFHKAWGGDELAFKKLRELADAGDAHAQNGLGNFYAEGKFVTKDEALALQWWTRAAEQGEAVAQYNVAQAHLRAIAHQNDLVKVNEWLLKAAEQGFLEAQIDLGVSYTMKDTPWFDAVQAYKWFTVGAANALAQGANGEEDRLAIFAYNNLTTFSKTMTKVQIAQAEKLARAWLDEYGIDVERERQDLDAFMARQKPRK